MAPETHALHEAIGRVAARTSSTVSAASRASAHGAELDGFWIDQAVREIDGHQATLDALKAELLKLKAGKPVAEAA